MLALVGALILGAAIFYIVYSTQVAAESAAAKDRIGLNWESGSEKAFVPPIYLKLTKPLLKGAYLDLAASFWKPASLLAIKKKLDSAGLGKRIDPAHFVAAKFWLASIVGVLLFLHFIFAPEPPPAWFPLGTTMLMFFYPDLHIKGLRDERHQEIRVAMPYVMDLLTLSMEAGKEFQGAVAKVVERSPPNPLVLELGELLSDLQLGKSRPDAMRKMADRIDMPEMTSLVAVLVSTDQMGVSIGNVLRQQSETLRTERLLRAEKLGAQASQKILLPMVFFILPAVFLIIFGPILLGFIGGGS